MIPFLPQLPHCTLLRFIPKIRGGMQNGFPKNIKGLEWIRVDSDKPNCAEMLSSMYSRVPCILKQWRPTDGMIALKYLLCSIRQNSAISGVYFCKINKQMSAVLVNKQTVTRRSEITKTIASNICKH